MAGITGAGINGITGTTGITEDGIRGTMVGGTEALSRLIRYMAAVRQALRHLP